MQATKRTLKSVWLVSLLLAVILAAQIRGYIGFYNEVQVSLANRMNP